jgi:hypothetical protein
MTGSTQTQTEPLGREAYTYAQQILARILFRHLAQPFMYHRRAQVYRSLLKLAWMDAFDYPIVGIGVSESEPGRHRLEFLTTVTPQSLDFKCLLSALGFDDFVFQAEQTGMPIPTGAPPQGGDSIGHPLGLTGTLGCAVQDSAGRQYALSCNHTLARANAAAIGDAILQPGAQDGGNSTDKIGLLHDFEPLIMGGHLANEMDAAICAIDPKRIISPGIRGVGRLAGCDPNPAFNTPVEKYGWRTKHTNGILRMKNVSLLIPYIGGHALLRNQYVIGGATPALFSDQGDSGSIIASQQRAIALLVATFTGVNLTAASPIEPVLSRFRVSMQ